MLCTCQTGSKVDEERSTAEKLERMELERAGLEKDVKRMKKRRFKQEQVRTITRFRRSPWYSVLRGDACRQGAGIPSSS